MITTMNSLSGEIKITYNVPKIMSIEDIDELEKVCSDVMVQRKKGEFYLRSLKTSETTFPIVEPVTIEFITNPSERLIDLLSRYNLNIIMNSFSRFIPGLNYTGLVQLGTGETPNINPETLVVDANNHISDRLIKIAKNVKKLQLNRITPEWISIIEENPKLEEFVCNRANETYIPNSVTKYTNTKISFFKLDLKDKSVKSLSVRSIKTSDFPKISHLEKINVKKVVGDITSNDITNLYIGDVPYKNAKKNVSMTELA